MSADVDILTTYVPHCDRGSQRRGTKEGGKSYVYVV